MGLVDVGPTLSSLCRYIALAVATFVVSCIDIVRSHTSHDYESIMLEEENTIRPVLPLLKLRGDAMSMPAHNKRL